MPVFSSVPPALRTMGSANETEQEEKQKKKCVNLFKPRDCMTGQSFGQLTGYYSKARGSLRKLFISTACTKSVMFYLE